MDSNQHRFNDLYPFQSHYLSIDGRRMHYVDEGAGPVILMLHGNPTWSFYYRELVKGLRDRYRVIAPDHIGCGLSDKPQQYEYTLETHIRNIERLAGHLGLTNVTLAVHDWGGAIGFGWAARQAEHVRRFIVFNTAAFRGPCPLRIRICRWPIVGDFAVRSLNAFARGAVWIAAKRKESMTPAVRRGLLAPYDSYANRIAILRFVQDIPLNSSHVSFGLLNEITASLEQFLDRPMLICWGAKDFCFNDRFLKEWETRFPEAEVHRFADAGHYVVEDAYEHILPLLNEFLSQTDATVRDDDGADHATST